MEYVIVGIGGAQTIERLTDEINKQAKDGWKPVGSPIQINTGSTQVTTPKGILPIFSQMYELVILMERAIDGSKPKAPTFKSPEPIHKQAANARARGSHSKKGNSRNSLSGFKAAQGSPAKGGAKDDSSSDEDEEDDNGDQNGGGRKRRKRVRRRLTRRKN